MYDMLDDDQLKDASPSVLAAENGKVETAVNVLKEEAKQCEKSWKEKTLEGAALILENEVL